MRGYHVSAYIFEMKPIQQYIQCAQSGKNTVLLQHHRGTQVWRAYKIAFVRQHYNPISA